MHVSLAVRVYSRTALINTRRQSHTPFAPDAVTVCHAVSFTPCMHALSELLSTRYTPGLTSLMIHIYDDSQFYLASSPLKLRFRSSLNDIPFSHYPCA